MTINVWPKEDTELETDALADVWEDTALHLAMVYGTHVDWDEKFYICPECGEPIYKCDWEPSELLETFCPVCGLSIEDE